MDRIGCESSRRSPCLFLRPSYKTARFFLSAGLVSSPQVLASPTGLLSLPIGVAGNLTQFMAAAGLKTAQGIRPGGPLFLSQVTTPETGFFFTATQCSLLEWKDVSTATVSCSLPSVGLLINAVIFLVYYKFAYKVVRIICKGRALP